MRTIKIYRPKMMEACACKLIVEMDGKVIGKLANGKDMSVEVDEQKHELYLHGGMFAGKDFSCKLSIPAGRYAYTLQTDMLSLTNGYKPMLRPCGTAPTKSAPRLRLLLGSTLTTLLLDDRLRDILAGMPGARLNLVLEQAQWRLDVCLGQARKTLYTSPYSRAEGQALAAVMNAVEQADLKTPEGREKLTELFLRDYVAYLPDYHLTGPGEFALNETL